jgi:hypothetical protein
MDAGTGENPVIPATFLPQGPVPLPAYEQPVPQLADQANTAPKIPEGGYASRFVTIPLPEFNQPGITCSVRLRNPGMMSQGAFEGMADSVSGIELGADGEPDMAKVDAVAAMPALYAQLLKLIAGWTMWDAESEDEIPPLLPSPPASVDDLKRAPAGALKAVLAGMGELLGPQ